MDLTNDAIGSCCQMKNIWCRTPAMQIAPEQHLSREGLELPIPSANLFVA